MNVAIPSAIEVSGDVLAAATALAGLILVFLGATSTSYDSYEATEQGAVRNSYQRRAWFAFVGFALSLVAALLALIGKWFHQECASLAAVVIFIIALILTLLAAFFSVREIK
jgi:lysylphosphatidylglycerol synthetase-like protein (DUF2156 family)